MREFGADRAADALEDLAGTVSRLVHSSGEVSKESVLAIDVFPRLDVVISELVNARHET